jgi:hypothetical protein
MVDIKLLPTHYYLSLPAGSIGYNGELGVGVSDPVTDTGIYTTFDDPSIVFSNNATRFDLRQAVAWYYNHQGYRYANHSLQFTTAMKDKMNVLQFQLYNSSNGETALPSSADPGDNWLYGNVPFFGRVASAPGSFQFAAMIIHPVYGNAIGAAVLSQATAVIGLEDFRGFLSETKPMTRIVYPETGEAEEYEVDFVSRERTIRFYDGDGILVRTDISENYVPQKFFGNSFLTTYPIQSDSFFFDAYGDFSGRYENETLLIQEIKHFNRDTVGRQYDLENSTFTQYPARQSDSLSFEGAAYYRIAEGWMPNINSHRII